MERFRQEDKNKKQSKIEQRKQQSDAVALVVGDGLGRKPCATLEALLLGWPPHKHSAHGRAVHTDRLRLRGRG